MTTVVDASVVVDWLAPDTPSESAALRLLERLSRESEDVAVPRLLFHEVANALLTGVRRGRWTGREADVAYLALRDMPVRTLDLADDADRAYDLSRRFDEHPVYDMVYLALAQRLNAPLIAADQRFLDRVGPHALVVSLTDAT